MPGDEIAGHELAPGGLAGRASGADPGETDAILPVGAAASPWGWPPRSGIRRRLRRAPGLWLSIFGVSLGLFLVRFLVPTPIGQADNRDGPRLMCGVFGLGPVVPRGYPRFFRYAYFQYVPASCGRSPFATSEVVPLEVARLLTPVFGLPGTLNLIVLGMLMCVLASVAIASLATGLRVRPWGQLLAAAAIWLIMADAAFFDLFASPMSEPAVLAGLLLVAAGVVYLGRDRRASVQGLVLAGTGGFLVVLAKEEYLFLAVPICLTLILASASASSGPWLHRFRTPQTGAAVTVAAVLAVSAAGYAVWNAHSSYGQRTQPMRVVDTIFEHIVNRSDKTKAADLRALGLPASWSRYAGSYYWARGSVRTDPLYHRYEPKLTDGNLARFLLAHPRRIIDVGQQAAVEDQSVRVTTLGDYSPDAGHRPGAVESRVIVVTWLVQRLPRHLGLLWLIPLWVAMAAVALLALRRRRRPWHRDGAVVVLCMTGCAAVAFIPPAFFDGISTARHMVGMNLATALAFAISIALAVSMIHQARARARQAPEPPGQRPGRGEALTRVA